MYFSLDCKHCIPTFKFLCRAQKLCDTENLMLSLKMLNFYRAALQGPSHRYFDSMHPSQPSLGKGMHTEDFLYSCLEIQ